MRSERSYLASSGRLIHSVVIVALAFILGVNTVAGGEGRAPVVVAVPRLFVVENANNDGPGSLRWAIEDANNSANAEAIDRIAFSIPGAGPHTIELEARLPEIIDPVVIDGFSQLGSAPNTLADGMDASFMIELDGSRAGIGPGLSISAGSTTVRGLWIHGFAGDAIRIEGGGSNRIEGNLIGRETVEAQAAANGGSGVAIVDSPNNLIGGREPSTRNVICGNGGRGVSVLGAEAMGNAILGNRIVSNGGDGIILEGKPATLNPGTRQTGPNSYQSAPVLTAATRGRERAERGQGTVIEGSFTALPSTAYRIELFSTSTKIPLANTAATVNAPELTPRREGDKLVLAAMVTTDANGRVDFWLLVPQGIESRAWITATATDPTGNTSEFSAPTQAPLVSKSWNNAAGGNWNVGTNWTPNGVPTSTDDAVITLAGNYTVTLDVSSTVASLTLGAGSGSQTLAISTNNTLTLNGASTVNSFGVLSQSTGTLTGAGTLTVAGAFNWSGGTLSGLGTTTINGALTISGAANKDITSSRTLNTTATTTWTNGAVRIGAGSVVNNSGTWDSQVDTSLLNPFGGTATFNNSGTFKKSAGTGTTIVFNTVTSFNNTGAVQAQAGTISLRASGTHTGSFSGSSGIVEFSTSTHNLNTGTSFAGTIQLVSGVLSVNSALTAPTFSQSGGTLQGTAAFTTTGLYTWTGGTMTGTGITNANGGLAIATGTVDITGSRTLNNPATATWTGAGAVRIGSGAVVNNTGTWDCQTDSSLQNPFGGTATFNNSGIFKKSAGTGTTTVINTITAFNNTGTVQAQTGTITLQAPGTHTGGFDGSGGTVQFSTSAHNLNAGTSFTGTIQLVSGTLNVNSALTVGAFNQSGGTLQGTATFTTTGLYTWTGGAMTAAGITNVNGGLAITTGTVDITGSRTLNNPATANWTGAGAVRIGSGAVVNNTGNWDCQTDSNFQNPFGGTATFNNSGTFRKSGGTGTTTVINTITAFNNTGTVQAQTGTIALQAPGTHTGGFNGSGGTVQFSTSTHNLNAGTSLTGSIQLLSGFLNINSPLTTVTFLQSGGTLQGTAAFTTTGLYTWTAGTMTAAGITNVNGGLAMSGGTVDITGGRTLNNPATATMSSNAVVRIGSGAVVNNSGTWDCQNDTNLQNPFGGTAVFNNSGTFKKTVATGITTVFNTLTGFHNTGSVLAQTGTISLRAPGTHTGSFNGSGGTVEFSTSTHDLNLGTSLAGTIQLVSGFLNINSPLTTVTFLQSGGTLQGTAAFTTTGLYTWTAGTMTAAGITNVNGGLAMSGGTVDITGGRTLNNPATATMSSNAVVRIGSGAVVNNSGTWDCQNDTNLQNPFGGTAVFNNSGTFKKTVATGTTTVISTLTGFHNTGSVQAQTGTIVLQPNGTHTGSFNGSGGTLQFSTGTHNLNAGTSFAGSIQLVTGTLNVNSPLTAPSFNQSGGTLQGAATFTTSGLYTWSAGTMTGAGIVNTNGGLALNGGGAKDITGSRTLNTAGTISWAAGAVRVGSSGVINNSGLWDCQADTSFSNPFGGAANFNNLGAGTFRKSGGTGTTTVSIPMSNAGAVEALSGTLSFTATPTGFTQTAGSTTLNGGALTSTTTMSIQGGIFTGNGTATASLNNSGQTAPGLPLGALTLSGNYTQSSTGALNVAIGGTNAGVDYDQFGVTGSGVASLSGTLGVSLANGFVPAGGTDFTVMTYVSRTGTFTSLLPPGTNCVGWTTRYDPTAVVVTSVTLPTEVGGHLISADKTTLTWAAAPQYPGTVYDVLRGRVAALPVGSQPGTETCLIQNLVATQTTDAATPLAGNGFWYLVRERVTGCGVGTYGRATGGAERVSATCP